MQVTFRTKDIPDCYLVLGIDGQGAISVDDLTIAGGSVPSTRLPSPERTHQSAGNTAYYVDPQDGNDTAAGTSQTAAWRTLARVNATKFAPGDAILLRAGGRWEGVLAPGGSGAADAPIMVAPYGKGPRPCVSAREKDRAAVYLYNQEFWEITGLEITNQGDIPLARRAGVLVRVEDYGTAHHIHLKDLHIHDVNGDTTKGPDLAGIVWQNGGDKVKSRFDGLLIEGCHLARCDRNGIVGRSSHWKRDDWFPSVNVVIRGNLLEDIGGDGIVPIGCDGCLVERNVVRGAGRRCPDAAAGIWPWSCDNTVIQFNEVSGHMAPVDGQGFDSDWNCRSTLIQYNYSHDNRGGFLLVCNAGKSRMPTNVGNTGTVVRYNISRNDGTRHLIHIGGPVRDTHIYHNTCYVGPKQDLMLIHQGSWDGWADETTFSNNLFYVAGKGRLDLGDSTNNHFRSNLVFGSVEGFPRETTTVSVDPMLTAPGTGGAGLRSLEGYLLRPGSPCVGAGVPITDNGGRDFWGNPLPIDQVPDIGAHQRTRNKNTDAARGNR